jgi:hypothetical protein
MTDLEHALDLIDNQQISEFFLFMRKKTGNDATLTRLESMFVQGKTDVDFFQQLKAYAITKMSESKYDGANAAKPKDKPSETSSEQVGTRYSFLISVVLLFGSFGYLLFKECVTEQAFFALRFILPVGFAALGAWLPGSLGFDNRIVKGIGAVVLLVLSFFYNPAETHFKGKACTNTMILEGVVKFKGEMLKKIPVKCPELEKNAVTDDVFGKFKYTEINAEKLENLDSITFFADGFREKKCFLNRTKNSIFVEILLADADKLPAEKKVNTGTTITYGEGKKSQIKHTEIEFNDGEKPLANTNIYVGGQEFTTNAEGKIKVPENLLKMNETKIEIKSKNWDKTWGGEKEVVL